MPLPWPIPLRTTTAVCGEVCHNARLKACSHHRTRVRHTHINPLSSGCPHIRKSKKKTGEKSVNYLNETKIMKKSGNFISWYVREYVKVIQEITGVYLNFDNWILRYTWILTIEFWQFLQKRGQRLWNTLFLASAFEYLWAPCF